MSDVIPDGYELLDAKPGYGEQFGPVYGSRTENGLRLAFRVLDHHLNHFNVCHGGAMATFADIQLIGVRAQMRNQKHAPTISLAIDYLEPVKKGDWVECAVILHKETRNMAFTNAQMSVNGRLVCRSNAIYRLYN